MSKMISLTAEPRSNLCQRNLCEKWICGLNEKISRDFPSHSEFFYCRYCLQNMLLRLKKQNRIQNDRDLGLNMIILLNTK